MSRSIEDHVSISGIFVFFGGLTVTKAIVDRLEEPSCGEWYISRLLCNHWLDGTHVAILF